MAMLLTSTLAAHGVLRPPCSLGMLAADCHVRRTSPRLLDSSNGDQDLSTAEEAA